MEESTTEKTVRELGGEIWAEITQRQLADKKENLVDFTYSQELMELIMGVLARSVGCTIINDEDFPVTKLELK